MVLVLCHIVMMWLFYYNAWVLQSLFASKGYSVRSLQCRTFRTVPALHIFPVRVFTPLLSSSLAIPRSDRPSEIISSISGWTLRANSSAARMFARAASPLSRLGFPSFTPRSLACAIAAFVRSEIMARSCSATAARIWIVSLDASGISTARNSTRLSMRFEMKATDRESRSSLAISSVAFCRRHRSSAFCSSGRSARLPLSTSSNAPANSPPIRSTYRKTASRCASSQRPERPCRSVETR